MLTYNENKILKIIRWIPIIFVVVLSFTLTYLYLADDKIKFEEKIFKLKNNFIEVENNKIKDEVNSIIEYIKYSKTISEEKLKESLKNRVYEAHSIASNIYNENINKDEKTILKLIKDALRKIRFNDNRAYYFIHDIEGNILLYPLDKNEEGKNYKNLQDKNGYFLVKTIINIIKNKNENFDQYFWEKSAEEENRNYKKVTFSKYFEPLNIAISTGDYVSDYEKGVKKEVLLFINTLATSKNSYIFVVDSKNRFLAHFDRNVLKKDLSSLTGDYKNLIINHLGTMKTENSLITYPYNLNEKTNAIKKTSYIKNFNEWNWKIGKGYSTSALNILIKKEKEKLNLEKNDSLFKIIILSFFTTSILLAITFYLSNLVSRRFMSYNKELLAEMSKNREKDSLLAQQSKMAAMGEMLANIAHQWKQPLSVISTASSGIKVKKEFDILSDEELYEDLDVIKNSTIYLSKTIDDFSNFFKSNKALEETSTKKIWNIINNLIASEFKSKNIQILLDIKDVELYILSNELIQVMLNLLNNAKDQLLSLNQKRNFIFVSIFEKKENLIITIKDNAGGIDEKIIPRIFEPYFTTKHKAQGTGIGLYMCEQIISKNFKGDIFAKTINYTYKDSLYKGASLELSFPLKQTKD